MDQSAAIWLVLLAALVAANAPYFSQRLLLLGPLRRPKPVGWRLLELLLLALLTLGLGFALEAHLSQRQPQGWEFYAVCVCLFITLGFPGFVWCYLRRRRTQD
ncbi:MAG: DUF2818 family protein [Burkholderiaceae bacterium]